MVEHAERDGDLIDTKRFLNPGDNISPMGSEASRRRYVFSSLVSVSTMRTLARSQRSALIQFRVYREATSKH